MLKVDQVSVRRGSRLVLHEISLALGPGKSLAVVGESGAGKTTLISTILGFVPRWRGAISWSNAPVKTCGPALVMQEPLASFNPVISLRHSIMEPLKVKKVPVSRDRIEYLCDSLDLPLSLLDRLPIEVSIGQAQRAAILRALITAPPLILFDEPLSALDAVTQKRTARLISDLQKKEGFSAFIVTHDLGYAIAHTDDIAVLRSGRLEEDVCAKSFLKAPTTPYCRALRDAAIALGGIEMAL